MQLVIGGELVQGRGTEADPVLNPASEEVLAEIPSATVEDVFAAVDAARAAGPAWGSTTPAVRAGALLKLADLLEARADEFARIEAANVGKPLAAAAEEIPLCADHLRFFAGAARVLEAAPPESTSRATRRWSAASRSASSARSRPGTIRWRWRSGRSRRRWPRATPSS